MTTKNKKKVLFTSHTANFSKFNRPFMRWFKSQGYEVHYASAGEEEVLDCDQHFTVSFERSPFKLNNLRAIKQLKNIIDTEGYDIIHTHTPMGSVVTRLAAKAARKKGTRVIYTAHGFHFFTGAPILNWLIYYPIEKVMAKYTDTLITINNEDYKRAKRKFNTDVKYVPGVGIDPKKFDIKMSASEKLSLRKSLGLKKDDFVMIYIAELNKNKNQSMLMDVMSDLILNKPNIHLLLVGGDSLNGYHRKQVEAEGLGENVHFLGYRDDIPEILKVSDLSVSTSQREGLPVNVIEGMYMNLPAVVTDCRGNRDLVQDGVSGFIVNSDDTADLSRRISDLVENRTVKVAMGLEAKKRIQVYELKHIISSMDSIYNSKGVILHLLNSNKFSGAENVVCSIIGNTSDAYESFYCSPKGDISDALQDRSIKHIQLDGLSYSDVKRIVREYRPSIIHAHDFKASIIASFFTKSARVVSHIHQNPEWLGRYNLKSFLYRSRLSKFDRIVTVTDIIKKNAIFKNISPSRLITLHNFIDRASILQKSSQVAVSQYDIAFCGRLEDVKQPLNFIKIISKISEEKPDIRAVIIGDGTLRAECESLIIEKRLGNNIDLIGFQSNPYPFIRNSKFLMMTSQAEGFGLVTVEALVLDTLVLAYDIVGLREVLGSDTNVLCSSADDMCKKYIEYSNSSARYKQGIKDGQLRIENLFQDRNDWKQGISRLYIRLEDQT